MSSSAIRSVISRLFDRQRLICVCRYSSIRWAEACGSAEEGPAEVLAGEGGMEEEEEEDCECMECPSGDSGILMWPL